MTDNICRWGIMGTAAIARKNWQAIRNADNAVLTAVASRSEERALEYIQENQAQIPHPEQPRPIGGYEAILEADDIDAVYIPLPTGVRKDYVIAAAKAGKHVLCEKPCGPNAGEVKEMIDACAEAGVQFMDGVMFMHSDRLPALRTVLDDGTSVGNIKRIMSQFSFCAPEDFYQGNIRVNSSLEPLGCLGDLGWYTIRFSLWTMNYLMPEKVTGRLITTSVGENPVPVQFSGELIFPGNITAGFYCSFETEHQQWVNVSGDKGHVHLRDFVLPYYGAELDFEISNAVFETIGCNFHMEDHTRRVAVSEYSDSHHNAQETKLFQTFSDLVISGNIDPHWPNIAHQTQVIMDACLHSAKYGGIEVSVS